MYVAKLPGRQLLDPAVFDTGDKAQQVARCGGPAPATTSAAHRRRRSQPRPLDPGLDGPAGRQRRSTLRFKSSWDIEWDFDYGYVLTTTDGGETYTSHAVGERLHDRRTPTRSPATRTRTPARRPTTTASPAPAARTPPAPRRSTASSATTPAAVFLADSYDISDLAGAAARLAAVQLRHRPGPGPAGLVHRRRQGHRDDADRRARSLLQTDFETDGGPDDPRVFNGGCQEDLTTARRVHPGLEVPPGRRRGRRRTTPTTSRCATAPASTSTATARSTATRSGSRPGSTSPTPTRRTATATPAPTTRRRSRRSTRPRSRATTTPNLNDAAFTAAAARSTYTDAKADARTSTTTPTRPAPRATGSSPTTASASTCCR